MEPINCFSQSNVAVWANICGSIRTLHPKSQFIITIRYLCSMASIWLASFNGWLTYPTTPEPPLGEWLTIPGKNKKMRNRTQQEQQVNWRRQVVGVTVPVCVRECEWARLLRLWCSEGLPSLSGQLDFRAPADIWRCCALFPRNEQNHFPQLSCCFTVQYHGIAGYNILI